MKYEYDAILHEIPENGGAYVAFPWDIRAVFGRGRVKVHAEFGGVGYDGSIVNMGVKTRTARSVISSASQRPSARRWGPATATRSTWSSSRWRNGNGAWNHDDERTVFL